MARKGSGKGSGTNMRRVTHIATSRKAKKRKAAVSRKTPQPAPAHGPSNTTPAKTPELPPFPDTSSLDAANQVVREWHRRQRAAHHEIAATAVQRLAQSAVFAGEGSLTADATLVASEAPDTAAFTGTVAWPEYQEVLARLAELEATVAKLSPPQSIPGIGHNNPPPVDITELEEIKAEIALLKAQPPPRPVEASKAASKLLRRGAHVLQWCGKHVDTSVNEFAKALGKTAGITVGLSPIWLTFGHQLTDTATAIMRWLLALLGWPS